MSITRRQFVKGAAIAGGAVMMTGLPPFLRHAYAYAVSMPLQKFMDPMPLFGSGIPLAATAGNSVYGRGLLPADRRRVPSAAPLAPPRPPDETLRLCRPYGEPHAPGRRHRCHERQAGSFQLQIRAAGAHILPTTRPSRARGTAAAGRIGRRSTSTAAWFPGPATAGRSTGSAPTRVSSAPR